MATSTSTSTIARRRTVLAYGGYEVLHSVAGALCSDGRRRTCSVRMASDTSHPHPAWTQVRGRTIAGWLVGVGVDTDGDGLDDALDYHFGHDRDRRNGGVLPPWPVS